MLVAVLAAAAAALAPNSTLYSDDVPPPRYRGDAVISLRTADQEGIDKACHPRFGKPPAGMKTDACAIGKRVIMPNPCTFDQGDRYAQLLCHEIGHVNGWPGTHGD